MLFTCVLAHVILDFRKYISQKKNKPYIYGIIIILGNKKEAKYKMRKQNIREHTSKGKYAHKIRYLRKTYMEEKLEGMFFPSFLVSPKKILLARQYFLRAQNQKK